MKIQLDTTKKTIKIDENVKITKLMATIKKLLPHGEWMDFTLETNTVINNWHSPYYIQWNTPTYPWFSTPNYVSLTGGNNTVTGARNSLGTVTGGLNMSLNTLNPGVYNVEVK